MTYQEEIKYREHIHSKIYRGEKATAEDRLWLVTHRIYNLSLGYPHLNTDVIQLTPKKTYEIRIKLVNCTYSGHILPLFSVPGGKGKIIFDAPVTDIKGSTFERKPVKMLALYLKEKKESKFLYTSDLGLLGISFECEYYSEHQHLMVREISGRLTTDFAMLCEQLAENKMLYRCKAPKTESFDSLVFSVEWM